MARRDATISAQQVRRASERLHAIGFVPTGKNPNWYRCVVVSMVADSGTKEQIIANAYFVADTLGVQPEPDRKGEGNPCFHFGYKSVRNYFGGRVNQWVGGRHTLDDLTPFCVTHNRTYKAAGLGDDPCDPGCMYEIRFSGAAAKAIGV